MPFDGVSPPLRSEWRSFLVGLFFVLGFAIGMAVLMQELAW